MRFAQGLELVALGELQVDGGASALAAIRHAELAYCCCCIQLESARVDQGQRTGQRAGGANGVARRVLLARHFAGLVAVVGLAQEQLVARLRLRVIRVRARRRAAGPARRKHGTLEERTLEGFLEGKPELGRHELIEQRIDGRAQIVHDARDVGELQVNVEQKLVLVLVLHQVGGEQALGVKGEPADEEGDDDGNCAIQVAWAGH